MKYEKVNLKKKVRFDTIEAGELFKFGNKIFMKIKGIYGVEGDVRDEKSDYTAVDMDGYGRCVCCYELVEKVTYNLQIDY